MNRSEFRKLFKTVGPAILPVIHTLDIEQACRNIVVAVSEGAQGVFLINHDFEHDQLLPILVEVRRRYPWLWLGANFLAVTGKVAFPILGSLEREGTLIDAYWADDARIDERVSSQIEADEIAGIRAESGWSGMYFGGTAFKKQREVEATHYHQSAMIAAQYMDAVTTSGVATGMAADVGKIRTFREACGEHVLAIASGVTPENLDTYAPLVDAVLIATGINYADDFYNIDPDRLKAVVTASRHISEPMEGKQS